MSDGRLRAVTIALLAVAAVLSVVAQKTGQGWLTAVTFTLFGLAVIVLFRWRQQVRARVLDREEKTSE